MGALAAVENDCVAAHLNGGGDSSVVQAGRDRDKTHRMRAQLGPGFPAKKCDTVRGDANVNERQTIDGGYGHEQQELRKLETIEFINVEVDCSKFSWRRLRHGRLERKLIWGGRFRYFCRESDPKTSRSLEGADAFGTEV